MYLGACIDGQAHILSYLKKQTRQWPAGTHFNYNTAETDLLGILVQRATHRSLAAYLSDTIWQPYGMAADAYWIKDECDGSDTGGSAAATLGDYARLGQLMLDGGRIAGKPVVAKASLDGVCAARKTSTTRTAATVTCGGPTATAALRPSASSARWSTSILRVSW